MKKALPYLVLLLIGLTVLHFAASRSTESVSYIQPAALPSSAPYPVPAEVQPSLNRLGIHANLRFVIASTDYACKGGDNPQSFACFTAPDTIYISPAFTDRNMWQQNTVTAHEYLHYVWSTMTPQERAALAPYITEVYHQHAAYLNQRLSGYKVSDALRLNELHSFIGTEIDDWELPLPLMQHYQHYIPNRGALPSFE